MSLRKLAVVFVGCFFMLGLTLAHADQTPTKKKWTFMVFMNGNNNLDRFGVENLKAMEKVGSNDDVNIVVQWASISRKKVVRLLIQKSNDPTRVTSPVIQDLGSVDMGSYKSLEDFVTWTAKNYPADHYFIDVWNHGNGWEKKRLANTNKDISYDDLTGNKITTEELGVAMAHAAAVIGHKVDIYGSDACLMGMAEVANEMSDSVQYFVGSQEVEPGEGWPYAPFLAGWEAKQNATAVDVSTILTQEFVRAYQPGGVYPSRRVVFSAYDLSKLPVLNKTIYALGETLRQVSPDERSRIVSRFHDVQTFYSSDYADLIDLMTILSTASQQSLHQEEINAVIAAAREMIIANKTTAGYGHANGLSVWLPTTYADYKERADRYDHLQFGIQSEWNKTLDYLLQGVNQQHNDDQQQPDSSPDDNQVSFDNVMP